MPGKFSSDQAESRWLRSFFERAKRGTLRFAWEPRGEWATELVRALCKELDLIHVVDPFQGTPADVGRQRYYRLHGISGPRHKFTDDQLRQVMRWTKGQRSVFCFFNNVSMAADAVRLRAERALSSA